MNRYFSILFSLFIISSYASKNPYELGNVTKEELMETRCTFDTAAHAYYHFDMGSCQLGYYSGKVRVMYRRQLKLKVLDAVGTDAGNIILPLYEGSKLEDVKAFTYNIAGGKVVKIPMKKDNIQTEKISEDEDEITFNLPMVQAGSIIEVEYEISSEGIFYLYPWLFQSEYPKAFSSYTTYEPEDLIYDRQIRGFVKITQTTPEDFSYSVGGGRINAYKRSYFAYDVPAFKVEEFIGSPLNYITAIRFKLTKTTLQGDFVNNFYSTWADVDKELMERKSYGKFITRGKDAEDILATIPLDGLTDQEKMVAIYDAVNKRMKWDGHHTYGAYEKASTLWEDRTGTSGELNLLLTLLLNEAGLEAEPVAMSTRSNGAIYAGMPTTNYFNHSIATVVIEDERYFLDLTGGENRAGQIPYKDLNNGGRLPMSGNWVELTPSGAYSEQKVYSINFTGQLDTMVIKAAITLKDYAALEYLNDAVGKDFDELLNELRESETKVEIQDWTPDELKAGEDVRFKMDLTSNQHFELIGERLFVNPFPLEEFENPFIMEKRVCPIDLGCPVTYKTMCTITIPEGYVVDNLPKPANLVMPDKAGRFLYQANAIGNMIQVNFIFEVNHVYYSSESYDIIRYFFKQSLEKINESIVLKKS